MGYFNHITAGSWYLIDSTNSHIIFSTVGLQVIDGLTFTFYQSLVLKKHIKMIEANFEYAVIFVLILIYPALIWRQINFDEIYDANKNIDNKADVLMSDFFVGGILV